MREKIEAKCTLTNEELKTIVTDWIDKLCKSGGNSWCLQVPVNFNKDPDMTILELVNRFSKMEENNKMAIEALEKIKKLAEDAPQMSLDSTKEAVEISCSMDAIYSKVDNTLSKLKDNQEKEK